MRLEVRREYFEVLVRDTLKYWLGILERRANGYFKVFRHRRDTLKYVHLRRILQSTTEEYLKVLTGDTLKVVDIRYFNVSIRDSGIL